LSEIRQGLNDRMGIMPAKRLMRFSDSRLGHRSNF
jgi:hypothetical protein